MKRESLFTRSPLNQFLSLYVVPSWPDEERSGEKKAIHHLVFLFGTLFYKLIWKDMAWQVKGRGENERVDERMNGGEALSVLSRSFRIFHRLRRFQASNERGSGWKGFASRLFVPRLLASGTFPSTRRDE